MAIPDLFSGVDEKVQAQIRKACGWHIAPLISEEHTLDGTGSDVLLLPTLKLKGVSALTIAGTIIDVNLLEFSEHGMIRVYTPAKFGCVKITFAHGYDECPPDVRQAATQLTSIAARPVGLEREQAGSVALGWSSDAPIDVEAMSLAAYRLPPRP